MEYIETQENQYEAKPPESLHKASKDGDLDAEESQTKNFGQGKSELNFYNVNESNYNQKKDGSNDENHEKLCNFIKEILM